MPWTPKIANAAIVIAVTLLGVCQAVAWAQRQSGRRQIVLTDGWLVKQLENDKPDIAMLTRESANPDATWMPARMPAQVHELLLERGLIPDPRISKNAAACTWVGEKDWAYVCRFATPSGVGDAAFLRFEGLDTLANAYLNGSPIGQFENMFRQFNIRVKSLLAPAGQMNVLLIVFSSPQRYARAAALPPDNPNAARHKSLRKSHGDFGSYLGAAPNFMKVGVFREVVLDLPEPAWIDDLCIRTTLAPGNQAATVRARLEIAGGKAAVGWVLTDPSGVQVAAGRKDEPAGDADIEIAVPKPLLWWPRMYGQQNLYTLEVSLLAGQRVLDTRRTAFGIREIKPVLVDPATGEKRFRFDINGQPIFMRGACWAPVEGLTHVWPAQRAKQLLDLVEQGNMNILRIWGEGVQPPPYFYEECDRRGICIWQDFMFGWYDHRQGDTVFLDNCRAEVEGMIRQLRNHPSLLLWVGGNEQYLWTSTTNVPEAKREIFEHLLPEACQRLDPTRIFHVSSPYGGVPTGNYPLEGDWHDYTTINYEPLASVPLFASEVLRASTPSLTSMRRFLSADELWPKDFSPTIRKPGQPAWPPMWSYRSTGIATWDRVGAIEQFCEPTSAEDLIRVIGTAHGQYLRDRVERERRGVPDGAAAPSRRCWGNMVWRLNDSWPIIYSSVIDYYLDPKIAYYYLRQAYEPVLVSFEQTNDRICVWVTNDSPTPVAGTLSVRKLGFDGKSRGRMEAAVSVQPGESKRCLELTELGDISLRTELLHATFAGHESTRFLIGERYLHLPPARLTAKRNNLGIEISTDLLAKQVMLQVDGGGSAAFVDNYFDLLPGQARFIALGKGADARLIIKAVNAAAFVNDRTP